VEWARDDRRPGTLEGGKTSRALGINNRGEVVGVSHTPRGNQAFVWTRQAGMQNLNKLVPTLAGFVLTDALAINGKGVILAIGQEETDHVEEEGHAHDLHELPVHVFLLRPQP
jgi:probable HAF family extracellular repeat protein